MNIAPNRYKNKTEEEKKQYWLNHTIDTRYRGSLSRAKKLNRLPIWSNKDEIKKIYAAAVMLSEEHNIKYEVDHIIPLNGENVSGLHVPENLQILTQIKNSEKSNRF